MEDAPGTRQAQGDVALQRQWRMRARLSSAGDALERFLEAAGFERGPWLTVAFGCGIALWFLLSSPSEWLAVLAACLGAAVAGMLAWRWRDDRVFLRMAVVLLALAMAGGMATIWTRSAMVGVEPVARPMLTTLDGKILQRIEQPAQGRIRLVLATREPESGRPIKVRVNVPQAGDGPALAEGAVVRLQARLMPPAPPMLPGGYNFARRAWFDGIAATGTVLGAVEVLAPAENASTIARWQRSLSAHVRSRVEGSAGAIAANLASGDRGAIAEADHQAMRDSGLAHLMAISGLHVSAVIGATYLLAIRLLAFWPWLALRAPLPVLAATLGALAGIAYTVLTGMQVPTIRSCTGAVLVLIGLALGRDPLSLRMVAMVAFIILLLWPETLVSPGFQMSFTAVVTIIALHQAAPVRRFLAAREESGMARTGRRVFMLFLTALAIELALMPITLFHFHRGGIYGALANVPAIPLVTFVTMPLIALALLLDIAGLGAPVWWLVGQSIDSMLALAHWTANQPGAVKRLPVMEAGTFALFAAGGLWLALWRGRLRLFGLLPAGLATLIALNTPTPDILITGDGRQVGITGEGGRLLLLRDSRSSFTRDNLLELSGMNGEPVPFSQWSGANCSRDFCSVRLYRDGRYWYLLLARSRERVEERALAAACERADIVVADRWLPRSCRPRWLKADRAMLQQSGGLAVSLRNRSVRSVAEEQGRHGWWK